MEGIRSDEDEADDKDKLSDGKKKRADKFGLFALEQKTSKFKNASEKRDDLLSLLTRKTVEVESKSETVEKDEVELSPEEERQIEQAVVHQRQEELQAIDTNELDQDALEAIKAVNSFHEKILSQAMDSNQSLAETLNELNSDEIYSEHESKNSVDIKPQTLTEELISIDRVELVDNSLQELTEAPISIKPVAHKSELASTGETDDDNIFTQLSKSIAAAPRTISSFINQNVDRTKDLIEKTEEDESNDNPVKSVDEAIQDLSISREGRIKSEASHTQVKNSLEQKAGNIKNSILAKESIIRQMVSNSNRIQPNTHQELLGRTKAPEASRLHSSVAPERIGHILMTTEANKTKTEAKAENTLLQPIDRHVETISRVDLLELSEQATVDGSSLRQAYETNLISEKALRRLVAEHMRGGDVRRALRRELVEHEKDFERDPLLRDKSQATSSSSNVSSNKLTQQLGNNRPEVILESITINNQTPFAKRISRKQKRLSLLDVAMLVTILVLLFMVIALVINRQ